MQEQRESHNKPGDESSPEARLKELQRDLSKNDSDLQKLTTAKQALSTDIDALKQIVVDFGTTKTDYDKAYPALAKHRSDSESYERTKSAMIICALKHNKEKIDEIIAHYDHKTHRLWEQLEQCRAADAEAAAQVDHATKEVQLLQQRYDDLKNIVKLLTDKFKALDAIKQAIDAANTNNTPADMYVYMGDFHKALADCHVPTPEHLDHKLLEAWRLLDEAKTLLRNCEARKQDTAAALSAAQTHYDDHKNNRTANLLKQVARYNNVPDDDGDPNGEE